ncbi:MAG: exosortase/archaeosortase family protein [Candidatus Bathyarchaeia archaeon]
MAFSLTWKEKPQVLHAIGQAAVAIPIMLFLLSPVSWEATAETVSWLLNWVGIGNGYANIMFRSPTIFIPVGPGKITGFAILTECSGLFATAVFAAITIPTIGLLRGPFWFKASWLLFGTGVGLFWNIGRLTIVLSIAAYFGMGAFSVAHYVLAPFIDFLWMLSIWALGISKLRGLGAQL